MIRLMAAWIGMVLAATAAAPAGEFAAVDVAAGFAGRWRVGAWTPLLLSATGGGLGTGQPVHVWAEDMDGQFVRSPPTVVELVEGVATARACVRVGRPSGRLRIEVTPAAGSASIVGERRLADPIASTASVLVCYGDLPAAGRAARLVDRDRGTDTTVVADGPPHAAAGAARAFDAADMIVVCGTVVPVLPPDVIAGIDAWVRDGGSLVFACGGSAERVAAGGTPAAGWLPGRFERLVRLRRVGVVEAHARVGGLVDRVPPAGLPVPRFEGPATGVVELAAVEAAAGQPLITRAARGLGTITWIGLDLDTDPLRGWAGVDTLLAVALAGRPRGGLDLPPPDAAGVPDLAGQLHAALDSFPVGTAADGMRRLAPVPFEVVAGLGLLYVLALYPFDWWAVSRLGRPWLAWLTLPLLATGFTCAAWLTRDRWIGGAAAVARSADVIDVDGQTGTVRGRAWLAVHSPGNDRLAVSLVPGGPGGDDGAVAVSWWGAAGRGFGGLDAPAPHPSLAAADYGYAGSLAALERVPVAAAASRLFAAEWDGRLGAAAVTSTLVRSPQGALGGAVAHHLPFTIENCRLMHAGWLYDAGTLRPGDRYDTAKGRGPRSLASALTRRAASRDREAAPAWDVAGIDVSRILDVAGLHAAAGGRSYTGLDAGSLGRLDLSPLLAVDRAVLVGTIAAAGAADRWRIATASGTVAATPAAAPVCRIVIPLAAEPVP